MFIIRKANKGRFNELKASLLRLSFNVSILVFIRILLDAVLRVLLAFFVRKAAVRIAIWFDLMLD